MLRKTLIGAALVVLAVTGVRQFNRWSQRVSQQANYDALEADRAKQRAQAQTTETVDATNAGPDDAANAGPDKVRPTDVGRSGDSNVGRTLLGPPDRGQDVGRTLSGPAGGNPIPITASRGYWPDFRGPNRDGRYDETPIRTDWPAGGLAPIWKQPVGAGYASFVVAEGRAFTIEQRRRQEVVAAYDVATGRELWTNGWDATFFEALGGEGPRATPTYHEGRVYALGAEGEFRSLDARTGSVFWRRNILDDADTNNLEWGMAASPLIVDDKVVMLPGGPMGKSIIAYDTFNGRPLWSVLDDRQAYTSPMLVTIGGVRQLLVVSAERVMGLTVENGRQMWQYPWVTEAGINVAQPLLLGNDRIFLSAGYGHGAAVIQLERTGDFLSVGTVWQNTRMKNKFTSSVLRDGFIYGLDEAILACVDAATGELKWKGGRYEYGQLLLAGAHLVVISEDGELALVRATPDRFDEVRRFPALEGRTWNHPVIAGGILLVRNLQQMAAFDLRPK